MPTANEMLVDACASGLACLSKRQLLIVWAQAANPEGTANALLQNACAGGFNCLDKLRLLTVIAQLAAAPVVASSLCPPEIDLGAAATYGVLAGTTVTNDGATVISGDLGVFPGSATSGFPPGTVNGTQHIGDAQAETAQTDLTTAYNDLATRSGATTVAGNIGGQTLLPGLYKSTSSLAVSSGDLILDGNGDECASFLFQIASTLTLTTGRKVLLINGAQAANVFWQVGSSATLNAAAVLAGSVLALTAITLETGASVEGRLLAINAAVTLAANSVIVP